MISEAPTSRAPRKIKGKHKTLLTWLEKSDRPVAMIASGATDRASEGKISGIGFARANIIGEDAIFPTIFLVKTPAPERPKKKSAFSITSSNA